jgi:predicted PurR-regulated permease PerM
MILVALVLVIGFFFFRVMAVFLLPMFFAAILVVIFRPLHLRLVDKCGGRTRLAAGLSTLTILAIVLAPLLLLTIRAGMDGYALAEKINSATIDQTIGRLRTQLGIASPPDEVVDAIGDLRQGLEIARDTFETQQTLLRDDPTADEPVAELRQHLGHATEHRVVVADYLRQYHEKASRVESSEMPWNNPDCIVDIEQAEVNVRTLEDQLDALLAAEQPSHDDAPEFLARIDGSVRAARDLQQSLLGGDLMSWMKERGNMDVDELQELVYSLVAPAMVLSRASRVGGALADLIIGLVVTVLSLYYFLADGPAMVATVMQLSPLDDRHERAMLAEFDRISRAVVVATLLSAVVQGLLAGVGYYLAGLEAVFLLTLLTMMLAMVPFVGAASVWGSCCIYLLLVDQPWAAGILAIYGTCVVSMMDNVIKPIVLHGQSNLHPLLALLSVLGGAKALGPIGILVGPMVVAFLQAVLNMLKVEITQLEDADQAVNGKGDRNTSEAAAADDSTTTSSSNPAAAARRATDTDTDERSLALPQHDPADTPRRPD